MSLRRQSFFTNIISLLIVQSFKHLEICTCVKNILWNIYHRLEVVAICIQSNNHFNIPIQSFWYISGSQIRDQIIPSACTLCGILIIKIVFCSFGADLHKPLCTNPHDGKKFLSVDFHVHIDQLFTMLFTNSKFYIELLAMRKTTDLVQVCLTSFTILLIVNE